MFVNSFLLAISSSIDSLGIGTTYGLKNTKISFISQIILFIISFLLTTISILFGNILKYLLPQLILKIIAPCILIVLGLLIIIQTKNNNSSFDFNNSNVIEPSEALVLGLTLSLDSLCIGIGGSILGLNVTLFPIFVATLQLVFLKLGNILGLNLRKINSLPQSFWSFISGVLLICIGVINCFK